MGARASGLKMDRRLLPGPSARRGVPLSGARRRARSPQENLAVASVEQLFEVVAPIEPHRLAIRLEGLEGRARQPEQSGVVLYDATEDVGHCLALVLRFLLDRVGRLQPDPDLVESHFFGWSSAHMSTLTRT